jgi:hypothetical protein
MIRKRSDEMNYGKLDERFGSERFNETVAAGVAGDLDMLLDGEYTDCVDWLEAGSWEVVEAHFAADGGSGADTLDSLNPRMRSLVLDSLVGDLGLAV